MGSVESLQRERRKSEHDKPSRRRVTGQSESEDAATSTAVDISLSRHQHYINQRSNSMPSRYRQDSVGSHYSYSAYSSSMEGGYSDNGDGMHPVTFGGDYKKPVPRIKDASQSFDAAHGNKLKIPLDSKQGSGFDLDWQYNDKMRRRVVNQRSLNPDHPLYHKLTTKIIEESTATTGSSRGV